MSNTYGIMFKDEMIRAYLKGDKTQTRRLRGLDVINQKPDNWKLAGVTDHNAWFESKIHKNTKVVTVRLPYGSTLNNLWFKECYALICKEAYCECGGNDEEFLKNHYVEYRADTGNLYPGDWPEDEAKGNEDAPKWKSSMFMPRKYSRFQNIPIVNVRVERLHDITEADAVAEGIHENYAKKGEARMWYFNLWDQINGKTYPAQSNPWLFVYEFPKYDPNQVSQIHPTQEKL